MTAPLIARASGIFSGTETLPDNTYVDVCPAQIDFDNDPNYAPPASCGFFVLEGTTTGLPSGHVYIRQPGYYRLKGAINWQPPQTFDQSSYLILNCLGTSGTDQNVVAVDNVYTPQGEHPTNQVEQIVKVTAPNTYYCWRAQGITIPSGNAPKLALAVDYAWFEVEYLGPLS